MSDWWTDLEARILARLEQARLATPADPGRDLGISEAAAVSVLALMAREGLVKMCLVAPGDRGRGARRASAAA